VSVLVGGRGGGGRGGGWERQSNLRYSEKSADPKKKSVKCASALIDRHSPLNLTIAVRLFQ